MPVIGAKRLIQKTTPYPSLEEALDAAWAQRQADYCEYAYVTEELRVVGIYVYNDVTPDKPVGRGQERVLCPTLEDQQEQKQ